MASPARLQVSRYLKGRGPSVVRVGTGELQVEPGDAPTLLPRFPSGPSFAPGQVWRIFGRTPGGGHSARRGVRELGACGASRGLRGHPGLDGRRGSVVTLREPVGDRRWRARMLDGRRGLRCVALRLAKRLAEREECERIREPRELIVVVEHARRGARASTAVAVAGPRLLSVDLIGPDGPKGMPAKGRGRIALAVLPGIVDPDSLTITARFHAWADRTVDPTARRALASDPGGGEPWEAVAERAYPLRRAGFTCVRWAQTLPRFSSEPFETTPIGECGDVLQEPVFFAVRAMREYDPARSRSVVTRRAVFGAAGPEVSAVTITDPDGSRSPERSRRGRAFISMYPASVNVEELSVTVSFRDGSTATYEGRRGVGVDTPRKPPLR